MSDMYSPASSIHEEERFSPERQSQEKRLVRKLDIRVLPAIFIVFVMNYVNRTAITAARLKGLEHDLHLTGKLRVEYSLSDAQRAPDIQYNVVLSILFVTLSLAQPPSNMLLNKIKRPSIYIGSCVVIWGDTQATTNFGGILVCRLFIGLPEASFYPGAVYLLSCWYTKRELAFRAAILFSGLDFANAFGALESWLGWKGSWGSLDGAGASLLFILEGAATICLGFLVMWLLPDFPRNTRWISDKESRLAQARLAEDAGEADQDTMSDSYLQGLKLAVADPLVWLFSIVMLSQHIGRSVGQFFPTFAKTLGYSTTITLLLTAPPWIVAAIICLVSAWHGDKTGERFFHVSIWIWAMMVGFIISLCTMNVGARYLSMFLMAIGDAGCTMAMVWTSNSLPRPPAKRAVAIGIVNGFGNLGTLIGSYMWKNKWAPRYAQSSEISLAALALSSVFTIIIRQRLINMNRKLDTDESMISEERVKKAAHLEGITIQQAMNKRKGYRYLY
ncbi:unnamed protein product [Mycena citricolor]|uniref:MFS general substrate transporter n=1 Tax=Mycena citricolor TaxID=2018698 RepID=A0AAD2H607_9AGAR|nr:unnamed protein product [Mycena citricolor]